MPLSFRPTPRRARALGPAALTALSLLVGCAPAAGGDPSRPSSPALRAAFSADGVAWISGGKACVARVPSYRPTCPALPPVTDVAWNGGDAWAAVPSLGAVVTLDRSARTLSVGRVVALSSTRIYREDGSALSYAGEDRPGVLGAPSAALTGGDGQDYVLLGGQLRRVGTTWAEPARAGDLLNLTASGVEAGRVPQVEGPGGRYRLNGERLERLDAAGRVVRGVPHPPGRVGLVGAEVVTVTGGAGGEVRAYTPDLELRVALRIP